MIRIPVRLENPISLGATDPFISEFAFRNPQVLTDEMRRHNTYSPLRNGTAKQFKFCNTYAVEEYASGGQKGNFATSPTVLAVYFYLSRCPRT
jgi:hypothetical protein